MIKYIKDIDENIEVAFITEDDKYALKAFEVGAFGYILKPYTQDKIENVIKKMIKLHILQIEYLGVHSYNMNLYEFQHQENQQTLCL